MTIVFENHNQVLRYFGHSDFIDNDLSIHLDSTEAFEGPEKTIEIQLTGEYNHINFNKITLLEWTSILEPVECQILSRISHSAKSTDSTAEIDVFLLSESTLAVHGNKIMLKTCGTTSTLKLLDSLNPILKRDFGISLKNCPRESIRICYSRPELKFPDRQKDHVHTAWDNEVTKLTQWFGEGHSVIKEEMDAKTHKLNSNRWYCWQNSKSTTAQKLEIIMHDIDENAAKLFARDEVEKSVGSAISEDPHEAGSFMLQNSGLGPAFPGKADAFAFSPCGWSANCISVGDDGKINYATAHVTPEDGWSYASYETTNTEMDPETVISIFKPRSYCIVWH